MKREYFSFNGGSFRRFDTTLLYIPFDDVEQFLEGKFKVSKKDTGVFFVSYIDFEFGIVFRPLCAAHFEENKFVTNEPNPEVQDDLLWQSFLNKEYTVIETNEFDMDKFEPSFCFLDEDFANQSMAIRKLRDERSLDPFRNPFIPDCVEVILVHENLEPESVVVKPIGLIENGIIGILDVEPHQNIGYHVGDLISFIVILDNEKPIAASHIFKPEEIKDPSTCVESSIYNVILDGTVSDLLTRYYSFGDLSIIDQIINQNLTFVKAPKTAKTGDIVFFYLSEESVNNLYNIKKQCENSMESIPKEYTKIIIDSLSKSTDQYQEFGKHIFAYARIAGTRLGEEIALNQNKEDKENIFVPIDNITILETPLSLKELKLSAKINASNESTILTSEDFEKLKNQIMESENNNEIPLFFKFSKPAVYPVNKINSKNWILTTQDVRTRFFTITQLKKYFIDFLIDALDEKKKAFRNCNFFKNENEPFIADYVMNYDEKLLPVIVKLDLQKLIDKNDFAIKVCNPQKVILDSKNNIEADQNLLIKDKVLVVDKNTVYLYIHHNRTFSELFHLKDLKHEVDLLAIRSFLLQGLAY